MYSVQPVLSGHLAIPRGWPLNTGSTVLQLGFINRVDKVIWPHRSEIRVLTFRALTPRFALVKR